MDLYFGAIVETVDGQDFGIVERVVVDLNTNEVTQYVVHSEVGRHRDVMVPATIADERIHILSLGVGLKELDGLPDYQGGRYGLASQVTRGLAGEGAATSPTGFDGQSVELVKGETVECSDGEVGPLKGVAVDEITDEVTGLIVDVGHSGMIATVPTAWARKLGPARIQLQCRKPEVNALIR